MSKGGRCMGIRTYAALAVTAPAATPAPAPTTPNPSHFIPMPNVETSCPPFCGVFAPAHVAIYVAPSTAVEAPAFTGLADPNPVFAGPPLISTFPFPLLSFISSLPLPRVCGHTLVVGYVPPQPLFAFGFLKVDIFFNFGRF